MNATDTKTALATRRVWLPIPDTGPKPLQCENEEKTVRIRAGPRLSRYGSSSGRRTLRRASAPRPETSAPSRSDLIPVRRLDPEQVLHDQSLRLRMLNA